MIRMETKTGWWLVTHQDHARLAGEFAGRWGNAVFARPEPRASVLHGIRVHDDGWVAKDAMPGVTREGKPAAFSRELVGRYSAFEEIDLADYLAVRERAVMAVDDPYAGLLVLLHTYNLLTERADRATIAVGQLQMLDGFLERLRGRKADLMRALGMVSEDGVVGNFRLLQAVDNLSLLGCVAYERPATLLYPLDCGDGVRREVAVSWLGERSFRLEPYPFEADRISFELPARHVLGKRFQDAEELRERFAEAAVEGLRVRVED